MRPQVALYLPVRRRREDPGRTGASHMDAAAVQAAPLWSRQPPELPHEAEGPVPAHEWLKATAPAGLEQTRAWLPSSLKDHPAVGFIALVGQNRVVVLDPTSMAATQTGPRDLVREAGFRTGQDGLLVSLNDYSFTESELRTADAEVAHRPVPESAPGPLPPVAHFPAWSIAPLTTEQAAEQPPAAPEPSAREPAQPEPARVESEPPNADAAVSDGDDASQTGEETARKGADETIERPPDESDREVPAPASTEAGTKPAPEGVPEAAAPPGVVTAAPASEATPAPAGLEPAPAAPGGSLAESSEVPATSVEETQTQEAFEDKIEQASPQPEDAEEAAADEPAAAPDPLPVEEPIPATTDPEDAVPASAPVEARPEQEAIEHTTATESQEREQESLEANVDAGDAPAAVAAPGATKELGLAGLAEPIAAGPAPTGGGGGGAMPEPPTPAPPPDTATMSPQAGVAAAAALRPLEAAQALGGVGSAVETTAQQEGEHLQAEFPTVDVGGDGSGGSAVVVDAESPREDRVEKVEGAPSKPTPAPPPTREPDPAPTAGIPTPRVTDSEAGTVRPEDAERVATAVESMPTTDPTIDTSAGPAPPLQRTGEADPSLIAGQRAALDATVAEHRTQGAAEVAAPAGEREVRDRSPRVTLHGPRIAGPGGDSRMGTPVADEAIGIIAEEKQGPQVRAEIARAQGDMAEERDAHRTKVAEEKTKADTEIAAAKAESAKEQRAEKGRVAREVGEARTEWAGEQNAKVKETDEKARKQVTSADEEIGKTETKGQQDAAAELRKGEGEARDAKVKAEAEAAAKKREAERKKKEESGGIFGWIASKVTSFFNALKEAITKVFDLAKALVKRAIEAAKKAALAVIEGIRKAVVVLIRAVGAALIALGDVLLAAFPGLRKKWRTFIQRKVKAAEAAVNKLADALKVSVTKLLDALGRAFEFLLDFYKKALLAVVGIAQKAALAAIAVAKAVADALGTWVGIIKDIASGPLAWIRHLGAAAVDGIRNHLWKAFKREVRLWFDSKLEEVLGLGSAIWGVLKGGGIALAEVGRMAFEALKSAIPVALIQLLIEKLVAMIIPAAGAVMAIIEGLQAAWGTVQRMLSAFGKFIAFLKAVAKGGAGPQFADLVASAAIVVIDFVANWLLKRLRKPAAAVGNKVRAIARKLLAVLKNVAKKAGRAARKVVTKVKGALRRAGKRFTDWRTKRQARRDARRGKDPKAEAARRKREREEAKQRRLDRAVRELKPAAEAMFRRGVGSIRLMVKLGYWRARYRLTSLKLEGGTLVARVNPSRPLTRAEQLQLGAALEDILRKAEDAYLASYVEAREKEARREELTQSDPARHYSTETHLRFKEAAETGRGLSWSPTRSGRRYVARERLPAGGHATFWRPRLKADRESGVGVPADIRAIPSSTSIAMGAGLDKYVRFARKETSLDISRKADTLLELEGVRKAGMSTALDVLWATSEAEVAAAPERSRAPLSRRLARANLTSANPMAPPHATQAVRAEEAGTIEGKHAKAIAERKRRVAQIFLRLRELMRSNKDVYGDGSSAVAALADAFSKWFEARKPGSRATETERDQFEATLKDSLVLFLKNYKR
ncbi:hypothetical protein BJY21_003227 [Kineosphaera limosa]|uniref:Uncharacterized protein n=1 Tax=Kineosphaera limosa NBRC 100340 TaxID=1184609 RepID=K6WF49_9MICO|nr:hypothetical protein [Kineosphaera limosa]NYE02043.1 hypothetical protein [Kineosphaera limosa]GAB97910.1 hypothetical protein KILIM_087_00150 [Kineosphaera limosa NBRC 100340]